MLQTQSYCLTTAESFVAVGSRGGLGRIQVAPTQSPHLPLALDRESLCWAQAWSLAVLVCACQAWVERALLQEAALLAR